MQELDVRFAIPFGFYNTALNLGISAGAVFPWGQGFRSKPSPLPERFYLGGDFSPVCTLGGPRTLWGFKTRGVGPTEPRRQRRDEADDDDGGSSTRDFIGGDLAVTAFADLSFDLPIRWLREQGIHAHIFAGSGNTAKLTQDEYKHFTPRKFLDSFRLSVGCGIVIPTSLFRLEVSFNFNFFDLVFHICLFCIKTFYDLLTSILVLFQGNYLHVLRKDEHDRGKAGFRFSFSAPS